MAVKLVFKGVKAFNKTLDEFGESLPERVLLLQKKIAIDLFSRIIEKNPVGNPDLWKRPPPPGYVGGRSRANWQISVGTVGASSLIPDLSGGVSTGDPVGVAQEAEAFAALATAKPKQTIWIFNNVRYIKRLEEGWSGQAPAGMVAVSVAEIEAGLAG